jgi:hypothetical protein
VERAYYEEGRIIIWQLPGFPKLKTHIYLALYAQVIKRIGATMMEKLIPPHPTPCPMRA